MWQRRSEVRGRGLCFSSKDLEKPFPQRFLLWFFLGLLHLMFEILQSLHQATRSFFSLPIFLLKGLLDVSERLQETGLFFLPLVSLIF